MVMTDCALSKAEEELEEWYRALDGRERYGTLCNCGCNHLIPPRALRVEPVDEGDSVPPCLRTWSGRRHFPMLIKVSQGFANDVCVGIDPYRPQQLRQIAQEVVKMGYSLKTLAGRSALRLLVGAFRLHLTEHGFPCDDDLYRGDLDISGCFDETINAVDLGARFCDISNEDCLFSDFRL